MRRLWQALLMLLPIAAGAAVLVALVLSRAPPARHPVEEVARAVRVVEAPLLAVAPRLRGHGVVAPARIWEGVAEVEGRIVAEHEGLERGALLAAGTLLLTIDETDYRLRLAQAEAALAALEARAAEIATREANLQAALAIEARALELGEAELARRQELLRRGAIARSAVDEEERRVLAQRQAVQGHRSALALIPVERRLLEAERDGREADLEAARRDLARTRLVLPFDARIAQLGARRDQHAARGQVLVVADSIDAAEVLARFPIDRLRRLLLVPAERLDLRPEVVAETIRALGLTARVRLQAGDLVAEWPARLARVSETIDPATRTAGVIVVVDQPYAGVVPGARPPLVKNMFVEVELAGRPGPPLPVVPRLAVEAGQVLVAGMDDRLELRPVEVAFVQGAIAVIASGLEGGERVVVSDLRPAIAGQRLLIEPDLALAAALRAEAEGTGAGPGW